MSSALMPLAYRLVALQFPLDPGNRQPYLMQYTQVPESLGHQSSSFELLKTQLWMMADGLADSDDGISPLIHHLKECAVQQRIGIDVGGTNTDAVLMQGQEVASAQALQVAGPQAFGYDLAYRPLVPSS